MQTHPFAALIPPLRYACQREFAQLSKVKNLRPLLAHAVDQGTSVGVEGRVLQALRAAMEEVDHPTLELRKAALLRVLRGLSEGGLALPPELGALVGTGSSAPPRDPPPGGASPSEARAGPAGPAPAQASLHLAERRAGEPPRPPALAEPPPTPGKPPVSAGFGPSRGPEHGGARAAAPKRAAPVPGKTQPRRRRTVGAAEARAEAKLLSIAPRHGPLATPLRALPWKINPRLLTALERKGLRRAGDVLFLLPRCYEDRRRLARIAELLPGERGVTVGVVKQAGEVRSRRGRSQFRAVIADDSGSLAATFFRSGPWLKARFPLGKRVVVSGELRATPGGREMAHPEVEPAEDLESSSVHFNRIAPVYPGFERHEQRAFRELAFRICEAYAASIDEPLPEPLRARMGLLPLGEALARIHFPADVGDLAALNRHQSPAHQRLAFDELFFLQLGMALKRQGVRAEPGISFQVSGERLAKAQGALPFPLTAAQRRVVRQIASDMAAPEPMNRLLQGDVGSGKTAVAAMAAMLALQDGYQVALMAPTEILAEQHQRTLSRFLGPLGYRVGLLSAGGAARVRREVREAVAAGEVHVAVGTHALIQGEVTFARLGLAIIDEQHRFGVIQRHALMSKGVRPDVLVMTATPIPRTLAMTLYGDLEVSIIDELPPGRTPIVTHVHPERQRPRAYELLRSELQGGRQAYVVYPLVEASEKLDLADATRGAEALSSVFPEFRVGLLHGRLKQEEKEAVMAAFRDGETDLLVCTTVVEVGVDVANASVMLIEAAERFGLSQLHQLRGRVGRGAARSYCLLMSSPGRSREAGERLAVMAQSADGFIIAERDLELRGPGEFLGVRQSGIPELAVANLARDAALLSTAQDEARAVVGADPSLQRPEHQGLVRALEERWEGRLALARVG